MKFSLLKVLSSVACVLVFGNAFGQWPQEGNNDQNQRTELTLVEILNIRDQQCQNRVLVGLGNLLVNASNSGDEGAMFNLLSLIASLRHRWYVLNPWLDIQRRIQELSQLPAEERKELELLQLKLDGLQLAENYPNLIDISDSALAFREFLLLQVTSEQKALSMLANWLILVKSRINDEGINQYSDFININITQINQFFESNQADQEDQQGYWDEIMNIRLLQTDLENKALSVNDSLKLDHPELTISAYENFLYQQQENQSAVK